MGDPGPVGEAVRERLLRLRPRTILYLFSGGKDSALALLLTRDFARELAERVGARVYMLYIVVTGNTHPLNAYAAATVMEWHRRRYGFEPIYRASDRVFQEYAAKFGLQKGSSRWCYTQFKEKIFREVERSLLKPIVEIDGMSPGDSKQRSEKITEELQRIVTARGSKFWAWHPLFSLQMSDDEKLEVLRKHPEFEPIVYLYEAFGDSMNCVVCPYKPLRKMMKYRLAEDARILQRFAQACLRSERWKRYFNGLLDGALELTKG